MAKAGLIGPFGTKTFGFFWVEEDDAAFDSVFGLVVIIMFGTMDISFCDDKFRWWGWSLWEVNLFGLGEVFPDLSVGFLDGRGVCAW